MWLDAESVGDFVMREDFPRMLGEFDTLRVVSDLVIFNDGRPAYWTGNSSIRTFIKQLSRHRTSTLRSTEFQYSKTANRASKAVGELALGMETSSDQGLFQTTPSLTQARTS
eukprot:TRINITY_DN24903_c0_g1_i1.p1 TRINITY_DN24903_c0_g1~~TRINITY_DN24903_c0_g1_i1.p1  ORF type:complete len:121 (-),score=20.05 TRINITY_DN24903_c0_g1_i1:130-465(-)